MQIKKHSKRSLSMVIDCFPFFNETEVLQIRLHELDQWVDRFIIVESEVTFSGNSKPLWFDKNLFKPFLHKITHLIAPTNKKLTNPWDIQIQQRDYAITALTDCDDDDIILAGDVDEIPIGQDFTGYAYGVERGYNTFLQKHYIFYMNLIRPGGWPATVVMPYKTLRTKFNNSLFEARARRRKGKMLKPGGWHFRNMGGIESVRLKLQASGHATSKLNQRLIQDPQMLHDRMEITRADNGREMHIVPTDLHPEWFKENIEKFQHLLTEEDEMVTRAARHATYVGRVKWCKDLLDKISPNKKRIGIEVGLWKADFAMYMLDADPYLSWIGVDPYFMYGHKARSQARWDEIYEKVSKKMAHFGDRFTLIRKPSVIGADLIEDGSVDIVFIDGNHDYEYARDDINAYERKVRPGGIMSGHDYLTPADGVRKAVKEYVKDHNRNLHIVDSFDHCGVWWWEMEDADA